MNLAEGTHKGALFGAPLWVPSAEAHLRKEFCSSRMTLLEDEDDTLKSFIPLSKPINSFTF